MIHKPRFFAAMNLSPQMRPPICLRYIIWALAAATTDRYQSLHPHLYARARKYAELDEMKNMGESITTVAHAQCWCLMATYEYKMMYFPRAWMSTGRAMRLAVMMGLHRQDGPGMDVKQCLPPPRDWTEREERRRTFWLAFTQDRYASIGTGWPMMLDERDVSQLPTVVSAHFERYVTKPSVPLDSNLSSRLRRRIPPQPRRGKRFTFRCSGRSRLFYNLIIWCGCSSHLSPGQKPPPSSPSIGE